MRRRRHQETAHSLLRERRWDGTVQAKRSLTMKPLAHILRCPSTYLISYCPRQVRRTVPVRISHPWKKKYRADRGNNCPAAQGLLRLDPTRPALGTWQLFLLGTQSSPVEFTWQIVSLGNRIFNSTGEDQHLTVTFRFLRSWSGFRSLSRSLLVD